MRGLVYSVAQASDKALGAEMAPLNHSEHTSLGRSSVVGSLAAAYNMPQRSKSMRFSGFPGPLKGLLPEGIGKGPMAKSTEFKRLRSEDFGADDQEMIGKLAIIINPMLEQINFALAGNITFSENISSQIKDIDVTVDSSGTPKITTQFKSTLNTPFKGIWCIRAENQTNTSTYPSSQPFVSALDQGGLVTINHISGLQADNKYKLKLLVI